MIVSFLGECNIEIWHRNLAILSCISESIYVNSQLDHFSIDRYGILLVLKSANEQNPQTTRLFTVSPRGPFMRTSVRSARSTQR